jgi:MFS family permease
MLLLPLTAGIIVANISAGLLISRFGRYKVFPVVGTVVAAAAMLLLATMSAGTPIWLLALYLTLLGLGVGSFMQVAMVAVQNSVSPSIVGTATSTVTFFREIGVTIGAAVIGGAFGARLAAGLPANLPTGLDPAHLTPEAAETLSVGVRATVSLAYVDALVPLFLWVAALFAIGLALAALLPRRDLRRHQLSLASSQADGDR